MDIRLINVETYTYDEFCFHLLSRGKDYLERFTKRISIYKFKPSIIITWSYDDFLGTREWDEMTRAIGTWMEEEDFQGHVRYSYVCQMEFECEEDAMYFKLRWL